MSKEDKDCDKKDLDDSHDSAYKPAYKKHPENSQNQYDSIPDDLAELMSLWPGLPDNIKEAIRAIIKPFRN